MKIYIVEVDWKMFKEWKVSQVGYTTKEKAVSFIKSREIINPLKQINEWCYVDEDAMITYTIREITIE